MSRSYASYASFEVLIESESEDVDEVKQEALEWIRKNAGELAEENIKVVQASLSRDPDFHTLKIGDRVVAVVDGKQEVGTIVSLLLIGKGGPQVFVRLDDGILRGLTVDRVRPLR